MNTRAEPDPRLECETFAELISAALDDEITSDERRALDAHLARCDDCGAYARALGATKLRVAEALRREAAVDRARLLELAHSSASTRRARFVAAAIAASVALASGTALLARGLETDGASSARIAAGDGRRGARGVASSSTAAAATTAGGHTARRGAPISGSVSPRSKGARQAHTLLATGKSGALLAVDTRSGAATALTTPPDGARDVEPRVSPDGAHVVFLRVRADGRSRAWLLELASGHTRDLGHPAPYQWAPRFRCNTRVRVITDQRAPSRRTHRSAREQTIEIDAARVAARPGGAAHLWRVPTSWSRDRCVGARMAAARNASGQLGLTLEVQSCRGARDRRGVFTRPRSELALWPRVLGNNVRHIAVSPDGRYIAVTLDREAVGDAPPRQRPGLLYVIDVRDDGRAGQTRQPSHPTAGDSPGPARMTALSLFLRWQRVATRTHGAPRWSADGSALCYLRSEDGRRRGWCWSARSFSSRRASPKRAARSLAYVAPNRDGRRVALLFDAGHHATLALASTAAGGTDTTARRLRVSRPIAPSSALTWLPNRTRGSPCPSR